MGFEIINELKKEKGLTNLQLAKLSGLFYLIAYWKLFNRFGFRHIFLRNTLALIVR